MSDPIDRSPVMVSPDHLEALRQKLNEDTDQVSAVINALTKHFPHASRTRSASKYEALIALDDAVNRLERTHNALIETVKELLRRRP